MLGINGNLINHVRAINSESAFMEQITEFTNFELAVDTSYIQSIQSSEWINFSWSHDESIDASIYDIYILHPNETRNYQDFNITVTLDYGYSYSYSMLKDAKLIVGSYYHEDGTYNANHSDAFFHDSQKIGLCGIYDPWALEGGVYLISGYPYGVKDKQITDEYNIYSSDTLTLQLKRSNGILNCYIKKGAAVYFSYKWTSGLTRPLNYIAIMCVSNPHFASTTNVKFTSLNATLYYDNSSHPTLNSQNPNTWVWVSVGSTTLIGGIITISIVQIRKRNTNHLSHNEETTTTDASYSWALEKEN